MKTIIGRVVSTKMVKTVVVERDLTHKHPLYKKVLKFRRRIKAHTDQVVAVGDKVKLVGTAPFSRDVHYKVVEKLA